jgi:hypothetical protein
MRLSISAREGGSDGGVGAGWGVCCAGGRKLASNCATFGGALPDGVPIGGYCGEYCGGKLGGGWCWGYALVGVGGG